MAKPDFPFFKNNSEVVYLDNAATTHKPQRVINTIVDAYSRNYAAVHRSSYKQSKYMTSLYEEARAKIAKFINADSTEIIFTSNTTDAINLIAHCLQEEGFNNRTVTVSKYEHNSNLLPWERYYNIEYIPDKNGKLQLDKDFKPSVGIISVPHITNTTGVVNPIKKLAKIAHKNDCFLFVDGAQGIAHQKVDVKDIDCDFYCFSGHKAYGPTGIGVLYVKREILKRLPLYKIGGGTLHSEIPNVFEAGTPNFVQALGLKSAIDYIELVGIENIVSYEQTLFNHLLSEMNKIPKVRILGSPECSIISFLIDDDHPIDSEFTFSENNIAIRAGSHCSNLSMKQLNVDATLRVSLGVYNTLDDINKFLIALKE